MTNYIFGHIEGQPIHSIYPKRRQCHDAKIHVNLQKGIGAGGASIVLSGGYEDDKDLGDEIKLLKMHENEVFSANNLQILRSRFFEQFDKFFNIS